MHSHMLALTKDPQMSIQIIVKIIHKIRPTFIPRVVYKSHMTFVYIRTTFMTFKILSLKIIWKKLK